MPTAAPSRPRPCVPGGSDSGNLRARIEQPVETTAVSLLECGDAVVAMGSYRGVYRANARAIDVRTVHVWRVQDGRITALEQFTDTLLVQRAMQAPARACGGARYSRQPWR